MCNLLQSLFVYTIRAQQKNWVIFVNETVKNNKTGYQ